MREVRGVVSRVMNVRRELHKAAIKAENVHSRGETESETRRRGETDVRRETTESERDRDLLEP